jgi:hypothetical protein
MAARRVCGTHPATREAPEPDKVLATILFSDIVGSTARVAEIGDARWRQLLTEHNARVRQQLARFRGVELDTAGDGFFARFDGPARGIHCAVAIRDALRDLGLEVRLGLHTGVCEVLDGKVAGIAVSIGAGIRAGRGGRGARVADRQGPRGRIGDYLRRPRHPPAEGRAGEMAALLRRSRVAMGPDAVGWLPPAARQGDTSARDHCVPP